MEGLIVVRWLFHGVLYALIVRHFFRRHVLDKDFKDFRNLPSPMFHVAIGERKITRLIVPVGGQVPPDVLREQRGARRRISELRVQYSALVFIYKHKETYWCGLAICENCFQAGIDIVKSLNSG